jgi:hypothetical protein
MGERRYSSTIFGLVTKWRLVANFTPLPLYHRGKSHTYPLDRRLDGPQGRSGHGGEEKNLVPAGNRTPAVELISRLYTDRAIPTPFHGLSVFLLSMYFEHDDGGNMLYGKSDYYQSIRRHNPDDHTLRNRHRENLRCNLVRLIPSELLTIIL